MPITKGAGNARWNRDETILALDLLYRHDRAIDKGHADATELSALLIAAEVHPNNKRGPTFRNSDGVALKLQNLLSAINPDRGLSSSKMDRAIILEFPRERAHELSHLATAIRSALSAGEAAEEIAEDEVFAEGHVLTSRHRRRDRRLRIKLLRSKSDSALCCAMCDFRGDGLDRDLREAFFEAHHIRPLADIKGETSTRLTDMALLCASCHRFLHKLICKKRSWVSIPEARTARRAANASG